MGGKIEVADDCLAPGRYIYMDYAGPDPYGVSKKIADSLNEFFHVSGSGICETHFNWDNSGDPKTFYFRWWIKKGFSNFSKMWVHISVKGDVSSETNEGNFLMRIHAFIRTEFKGYSLFLKPFWFMYSFFFYNRRRRGYIKLCNNLVLDFRNELKEHFNLAVGIERGER